MYPEAEENERYMERDCREHSTITTRLFYFCLFKKKHQTPIISQGSTSNLHRGTQNQGGPCKPACGRDLGARGQRERGGWLRPAGKPRRPHYHQTRPRWWGEPQGRCSSAGEAAEQGGLPLWPGQSAGGSRGHHLLSAE